MNWNECNEKKIVKETRRDDELIESLIKSSEKRLKVNERLDIDEVTSSTKISIVYESLREILKALAISKGFKIYNHECFCAFLDYICNNKSFSVDFDKFRRIRNKINYYGKDIDLEEAKGIIKDILFLRRERLLEII